MKIVLANDSMLDIDCARGIQQSLPTLNKKSRICYVIVKGEIGFFCCVQIESSKKKKKTVEGDSTILASGWRVEGDLDLVG